jgi:hypothetical protein
LRARGITGASFYTVTACDVVEEAGDFLYDPSKRLAYYMHSEIELWAYWVMVICAVILVRGISHNIKCALERSKSEPERANTPEKFKPEPANTPEKFKPEPANTWINWQDEDTILLSACICVMLVSHEGHAIYVTDADILFYVATILYCIAYISYHLSARLVYAHPPPIYNMSAGTNSLKGAFTRPNQALAGVLQLLSICLYGGADTPYNPIVLSVIATRAAGKLLAPTCTNTVTALMDSFYISLSLSCTEFDTGYLIALFTCTYLLARVFFA